MKKKPFAYINNLNSKANYDNDLSGYVPFLTNRAFAMHMDTVLLAEEMNQYHELSPFLQYEFYWNAVRKGKRFGFPKKPEEHPHLEAVCRYFNYSKQKGMEALRLLTQDQLKVILDGKDYGGM